MICIISPAKSLSDDVVEATLPSSQPRFLKNADSIARSLKDTASSADFKKTMKVSPEIASRTHSQYQNYVFSSESSSSSGSKCNGVSTSTDSPTAFKQAGLLFDGPAYRGLDCKSLSKVEMTRCNQHVRFLSGLYGLLKPSDLIQNHRLEMSTKGLAFPDGSKSLYDYWRQPLTEYINNELRPPEFLASAVGKRGIKGSKGSKDSKDSKDSNDNDSKESFKGILLDCASKEYSAAIDTSNIRKDAKVIRCEFTDKGKIVSVYAKRARGLMSRYVAKHADQVNSSSSSSFTDWVRLLKQFDLENYQFVPSKSQEDYFVFNRNSVPEKIDIDGGGGDEKDSTNRQVGKKDKR